MGKAKAPRRVGDNEALAVGTTIRGSAQKLNLVAALIRGKTAEEAMNILSFSTKGMAVDARKVLASATISASTSRLWLFSALAIAEASTLLASRAMARFEKARMFNASSAFLPRIRAATRFSFCAEPRIVVPTARASLSPTRRGAFALPISACPSCRRRDPGRSASARTHRACGRPFLPKPKRE